MAPDTHAESGTAVSHQVKRLNWGCGEHVRRGWINSDVKDGAGVDIACDIRDGLPLESDSIDYAVSIHALPELAYPEVVPALEELRRVLKPGGVLRLGLPDLRRGIRAYVLKQDDYFRVDESEVQSLGGRFILHMLWYGYSRTLFTTDFIQELLTSSGFTDVGECRYRHTNSGFPEIIELDNREHESLFVEGTKGSAAAAEAPYNAAVARRDSIEVVGASTPDEARKLLTGGRIRAFPDEDGESVIIQGWVLGRSSRATTVELVSGEEVVGRTEVKLKRPDLAEKFPGVGDAGTAGFRMKMKPDGRGESTLLAQAILEDGTRAPIEAVRVRVSRRRGLFGRRHG